jgi:hypothetical protein
MKVKEPTAPANKSSSGADASAAAKSATAKSATASASRGPADYASFLAQMGVKDRSNVERHLTTCEADPSGNGAAHVSNYRRLLCALAGLAPHAAKTHGQQAVQFYVPDGKYRMQVFALEDQRDGNIAVFCEDVLEAAQKSGLLRGPHEVAEQNNSFRIKGSIDSIHVDQLDGKTANPAPFYKDMLGWNRRALRITVPATATADQLSAVETLCTMAARKWTAA